jgi:hypothetical protein
MRAQANLPFPLVPEVLIQGKAAIWQDIYRNSNFDRLVRSVWGELQTVQNDSP